MKNRTELIDEIKQISMQYHGEVGRGRKAWPNSIKDRVAELFSIGMRATAISKATEISYFTVLKWRPEGSKGAPRGLRTSKFKELAVVNTEKFATVTVPKNFEQNNVTVTVTTPKGFRIEGSVEVVVQILKSGVA